VLAAGGSEVAALSSAAGFGALLVLTAVILSLRHMTKGQQQAAAASAPAPEQTLTNSQGEVLR
jgi:hypothetical protein